jgi:hypothetical protein
VPLFLFRLLAFRTLRTPEWDIPGAACVGAARVSTDPTPWLRLIEPFLRLITPRPKMRPHLVFIEQPHCWWTSLNEPSGGEIQLHLLLQVTNDGTADLIVSRTQMTGWSDYLAPIGPWQDCRSVELGGQRTDIDHGPSLPPRTTAVMSIRHHHKSERPTLKQPVDFLLRITDQHHRFHYVRLKVPPRD